MSWYVCFISSILGLLLENDTQGFFDIVFADVVDAVDSPPSLRPWLGLAPSLGRLQLQILVPLDLVLHVEEVIEVQWFVLFNILISPYRPVTRALRIITLDGWVLWIIHTWNLVTLWRLDWMISLSKYRGSFPVPGCQSLPLNLILMTPHPINHWLSDLILHLPHSMPYHDLLLLVLIHDLDRNYVSQFLVPPPSLRLLSIFSLCCLWCLRCIANGRKYLDDAIVED